MTTRMAARTINAIKCSMVTTPAEHEALTIAERVLWKAEPRWIPIEQYCPKMGKYVLISHNGVVSIDWLTQSEGVGYFFVSGVAVQDIDAWMSLPEPYKMDEEKE